MSPKATVHIVDDDEAVRDSLAMLLEAEGFVARTWASCAAFLHEAHLDGHCCLLADVDMPGMSGLSLLDHLRWAGKAVPAILMTGSPKESVRRAAERSGTPLLHKPFQVCDVVRWLEVLFRHKSN